MKYNAKYNRWFSKDGLVYRYDEKSDKLVLLNGSINNAGYTAYCVGINGDQVHFLLHRAIWETFKGEIPEDMVIDHKNCNRLDNRIDNLQCVTAKENMNNPLTKIHHKNACKNNGISKRGDITLLSDTGLSFLNHYGIYPYQDRALYHKELEWRRRHNKKFRWEV